MSFPLRRKKAAFQVGFHTPCDTCCFLLNHHHAHFVFQFQPYCAVKSAILRGKMAEIVPQNSWDWNARCKPLIINVADASVRLIAYRDARLVRPLHQPYYLLSILTGRTHEPCVPTCFKACNSSTWQLVYSSNRIGADARTVRPYMPLLLYCVAIGLRWILK